MPISGATLSKMRDSGMQVVIPTYNYWPAEEVAGGTIAGTPVLYPIGEVPVTWTSGAFADIEVGQLWVIRSGSELVSYGVVRKPATSSLLFIDGKSGGDPGIAVNQVFAITSGHQLTVYTMKPLWSLLSRIVDGEFFKQFDIAYTDEGANPAPVVNMGPWRQANSDSDTARATFTFDASSSFTWLSKTVSSYLYVLPASAVVTAGSTSSASVTFTLPEGFHTVKLTITDSGGASATGTRPVWVNGSAFPALSSRYAFEVGSDSQDRQGRSQSVTFIGDMPSNDEFLPGMGLLYTEQSFYDGVEITDGSIVDTFVGYASEEMRVHDLVQGEQATSFEIYSPWQWMEMIPMVSQAIVEVSSPSAWTDIAEGLGIPQFITWYVLKHHSTYLDLFDYDFFYDTQAVSGDDDNERKLNWGLNGSTLAEYVAYASGVIAGNTGCMSDGTLAFRRDPSVELVPFRTSLDELMTITVNEVTNVMDVSEPIEIGRKFFNETGQLRVFTLSYTGSETVAYGSIAPGYTQMQAPGSQDEDSFVVKTDNGIGIGFVGYQSSGQLKTNELAGHLLAKTNNPTPDISLSLVRNMDFFEPADMKWVRLSIPENWSPRSEAINLRTVPLSVDRTWEEAEGGAFIKTITLSVEPETFGQPGETYDLDTGGGETYVPVIPPVGILDPPELELFKKAGFLVAINQNGRIARSKNGVNWTDIGGNIASPFDASGGIVKFQDVTFDFYSELVSSGFAEGALGAWVTCLIEAVSGSDDYDRLQIWKTGDVLQQNVVWTLQYEAPTAAEDIHESVRIISNPDLQDFVVTVWHDTNGIRMVRTTDGGTAWGALNVGDIESDNSAGAPNAAIDCAFIGTATVASGWNTSASKYRLVYFSTPASGGAWVTNSPDSDVPWPFIEAELRGTRVYATQIVQTAIASTSGLSEVISEQPTVTSLGVDGTHIPVRTTTHSGTLTSSHYDLYIRGDPDSGMDDTNSEPPLIAGYHDEDRGSPLTSICGPATGAEYLRDDGWLFNSDSISPPISLAPLTQIKFKIDVRFKGNFNFDEAFVAGYFTFTSVSSSFTCIALSVLIGSHVTKVTLYDRLGKTKQLFQTIFSTDSDRWDYGVNRSPAITSGSDVDSILNLATSASDDIRRIVIEYIQGGSGVNYMMPTVKNWSFQLVSGTVETPTLHRITGIGGTPSYVDITPAADGRTFTPRNPYAMSIDALDAADLITVAEETAGGGMYVSTSSTNGSTWAVDTSAVTAYYGIRLSGGFGFAWGQDTMVITDDGLTTSQSLLGDWTDGAIDAGGLFRVLKGTGVPEY